MMATPGEKIISRAGRDVGKHETPPGSNWGPFVKQVLASAGWHVPAPWCCAWATMHVNALSRFNRHIHRVLATASCAALRRWAIAHKLWVSHPKTGYIGIIKADKHAVIVKGVRSNGHIATVAGNTSEADGGNYNGGNVACHDYKPDAFSGFVKTWE